jgi:hypothetical protein
MLRMLLSTPRSAWTGPPSPVHHRTCNNTRRNIRTGKARLKDIMPLHFLLLARLPAPLPPHHARLQRSALIVQQPMAAPLSRANLRYMTIRPIPIAVLLHPVMDTRRMEITATPLPPTSLHTTSNSNNIFVIPGATTLHTTPKARWELHGHSRCHNDGFSTQRSYILCSPSEPLALASHHPHKGFLQPIY